MTEPVSRTSPPTPGYREPEDYFEEVDHPRLGIRSKRFLPGEFAEDVIRNEQVMTLADEGEVYFYEGGYYHPKGEIFLEQLLPRVLGGESKYVSRNHRLEVIDQVKRQTYLWPKGLKDDAALLPLKNGVLNWRAMTFEPYDPGQHRFFFQIPVDYDPNAKCPKIVEFLESVVEAQDVELLIEIPGFCLHRMCGKQSPLLVGARDAGKTQYLELVRTFLGEANTCTVPLQALTKDKFASSVLRDKMANIYDDLSSKAVEDTGPFKALTGRGRVPFERKYKDRTDFKPYAKHIFACNRVPRPQDEESSAYFERLVIVLFPYTFVRRDPVPGSDEKIARPSQELMETLTDPAELSGFLNLVIARMDKVAREGLTVSSRSMELRAAYESQCNTLAAFAREECELGGPGLQCTKEELYDAYVMYCSEHNLSPSSKPEVGRKLLTLDPRIGDCRSRYDSADPVKPRPRMWRGIRPKQGHREIRCGTEHLARDDARVLAVSATTQTVIRPTVPTCTHGPIEDSPPTGKPLTPPRHPPEDTRFSGKTTIEREPGYTRVHPGYDGALATITRCRSDAIGRLVANPSMTLTQLEGEVLGMHAPDSAEVGNIRHVVTQVFDEFNTLMGRG